MLTDKGIGAGSVKIIPENIPGGAPIPVFCACPSFASRFADLLRRWRREDEAVRCSG